MRRLVCVYALIHAAAASLLLLLHWTPAPPPVEPARIEVLFGNSGTPPVPAPASAAAPSRPSPEMRPAVTDVSAVAPAPTLAAAGSASSMSVGAADTPGLRVERPDPTMIAAEDDPGNRGPAYPAEALPDRAQGTVVLRLHIDAQGQVVQVERIQSSGSPALDAAAEAALARWHFRPARRDGVPVPSYRDQPVEFVMQ
jgi:periplasmic protein TonB